MSLRTSLSTAFHRYLRVPYTLNAYEFQSPKRPRATFVFIHGIGNTLHAWDEVVARLPKDVRIIGIDLLGFGDSPSPDWAVYNAKTQARSVGVTLLSMGIVQQPIIVGHSLGALVAVEVAKRYSLFAKRLVLCSPPFYQPELVDAKIIGQQEDMLRRLYRTAKKHPEQLIQLTPLAVKAGIANKSLNVTGDNVDSYMAALESSIINQTSLDDVSGLSLPMDIFYGVFDPVVVKRHIIKLGKEKDNVTVHRLLTRHEVVNGYATSLADFLEQVA